MLGWTESRGRKGSFKDLADDSQRFKQGILIETGSLQTAYSATLMICFRISATRGRRLATWLPTMVSCSLPHRSPRLKIKLDFMLGPRAFHAAAIISDERRLGGEVKRSRSK